MRLSLEIRQDLPARVSAKSSNGGESHARGRGMIHVGKMEVFSEYTLRQGEGTSYYLGDLSTPKCAVMHFSSTKINFQVSKT